MSVLHGPGAELYDDWFCEAAWAGPFEEGDFDLTDIVAGTGGRLRDDKIIFFSSGSTVDRLQVLVKGPPCLGIQFPCLFAGEGGCKR